MARDRGHVGCEKDANITCTHSSLARLEGCDVGRCDVGEGVMWGRRGVIWGRCDVGRCDVGEEGVMWGRRGVMWGRRV